MTEFLELKSAVYARVQYKRRKKQKFSFFILSILPIHVKYINDGTVGKIQDSNW